MYHDKDLSPDPVQRHSSPTPPSPTATRHSSLRPSLSLKLPSLPTPELLGSIATGAHYSGALSPTTRETPEQHARHRKAHSRTRSVDDPAVENVYNDVMQDLEEIYCGRCTLANLQRRWRPDAVFEDPLCKCKGYAEYAPQWFALSKLLSKSERVSTRIISAALVPNQLVYQQTQVYTLRWLGVQKTITSIVTVELDDELKVIHLVDRWNGEAPSTRWGTLQLRKLNAKVTPWLISVPKNK